MVFDGVTLTAYTDAARSIRAHGWTRERSDRALWEARCPDTDPRFLFVSAGYNLRPTELQAAFGLVQEKRLDAWVARRRDNHAAGCDALAASGASALPLPPQAASRARNKSSAGNLKHLMSWSA